MIIDSLSSAVGWATSILFFVVAVPSHQLMSSETIMDLLKIYIHCTASVNKSHLNYCQSDDVRASLRIRVFVYRFFFSLFRFDLYLFCFFPFIQRMCVSSINCSSCRQVVDHKYNFGI